MCTGLCIATCVCMWVCACVWVCALCVHICTWGCCRYVCCVRVGMCFRARGRCLCPDKWKDSPGRQHKQHYTGNTLRRSQPALAPEPRGSAPRMGVKSIFLTSRLWIWHLSPVLHCRRGRTDSSQEGRKLGRGSENSVQSNKHG